MQIFDVIQADWRHAVGRRYLHSIPWVEIFRLVPKLNWDPLPFVVAVAVKIGEYTPWPL